MKNWMDYFGDDVISRGESYFKNDNVYNVIVNENFITANVRGTRIYKVDIGITKGDIDYLTCNCPHFESGYNCKHIAAVLFYLEVNGFEFQEDNETYDDAEKLLDSISEDKLKKFLIEELETNNELFRKFKLKFQEKLSKNDIKEYKTNLNNIFDENRVEPYFEEFYNDENLSNDLWNYLHNEVMDLFNKEEYETVFTLIKIIYSKSLNQSKYDNYFVLSDVLEYSFEILNDLLVKNEDLILEKSIFNWMCDMIESNLGNLSNELMEIEFFRNFENEEYLKLKYELTEKIIMKLNRRENYNLVRWIEIRISLMEKLKMDPSEIESFRKKYFKYPEIRKQYIEKVIKEGDIEEGINLLKESRKMDEDKLGLVKEYTVSLKNLYKSSNNLEEYEKELKNLVFKYSKGDLVYFNEFKQLYSKEEWIEKREEVFKKFDGENRILNSLYFNEKLYDRLMENILKNNDFNQVQIYEKTLKPLFSGEILSFYKGYVENLARSSGKRSYYRNIVKILKNMQTYPEGKVTVKKLIDLWKVDYKRRTAFLEELSFIDLDES